MLSSLTPKIVFISTGEMVVLSDQTDALRNNECLSPLSKGECQGTFGELTQGVLPGFRHFLVTLPFNLKSNVEF